MEDLEPRGCEEDRTQFEVGLLGQADTEGGRERRCMGGGTKGEKVGLSESPMDMGARWSIIVNTGK